MEIKKQKTEYDDREYRTGSTQPPKTYGGLIAVLLILVIFLSGISSILGLMNVHLFWQLNRLEERGVPSVRFTDMAEQTVPAVAQQSGGVHLGFSGEEVPRFWQMYHKLPQGIYIRCVEEGSQAQQQGIEPGDILISFDGQRLTDQEALSKMVDEKAPGQRVSLLLYRKGTQFPVTLTLEAAVPTQNG